MNLSVQTVLVSFNSWAWIRVALRSYWKHFPGESVLVVDNNRLPFSESDPIFKEQAWLAKQDRVRLIPGPQGGVMSQSHGSGMDCARAWCAAQGLDVMVHIEPDCLITGRAWRDHLVAAIAAGADVAGSHRKSYGPLHPTPGAWRVNAVAHSFNAAPRGTDSGHPRFSEVMNMATLKEESVRERSWRFFETNWDTAQRVWFDAAVQDRAVQVAAPGFEHFWFGSSRPPESLNDPRLAEYLGE